LLRAGIAYLESLHRPADKRDMQELDLGWHLTSISCHSDLSTRMGTDKKETVRALLEAHLLGRPATFSRGHLRRHPKWVLVKEAKKRQGGPCSKNEKETPSADSDLHDNSFSCYHRTA